MAKDKISDYSSTANSNTDIAGINIDEGCAPSGINDAIRTLMAQLKTWQSGGQDVYIHPAGSASAPSITANGDTNTGIFFPAADTVGITTGGTERARVDSSGNLGLGVTPATWSTPAFNFGSNAVGSLSVIGVTTTLGNNINFNGGYKYTTTAAVGVYQISNNSHIWYNAPSGTAGNAISFTQAMTLDASGNLGVGTTSPVSPLTAARGNVTGAGQWASSAIAVYNPTNIGSYSQIAFGYTTGTTNAAAYIGFVSTNQGSNGYGDLVFGTRAVNTDTQPTERARIDSSGNLLVGTTSQISSGKQVVSFSGATFNGLVLSESANTSSTTYLTFNNGSTIIGSVARVGATSAVVYNTTSDQRLKSNIENAEPVLDKLMQVQVRQYDWTDGDLHQDYGFIAQEIDSVLSGVVTQGKTEEDMWQLDYSRLTPHLVKAIQEQQAIINAQQTVLETLTARITALEQA
jgi:hypothetical protein